MQRPLPMLPKASYTFAVKEALGGRADPVKAARNEWSGSSFNRIPGDRDDPYVRLVMRGVAGGPVEREDFASLAGEFYGGVLRRGETA